MVRAAYLATALTAGFVIVPLASRRCSPGLSSHWAPFGVLLGPGEPPAHRPCHPRLAAADGVNQLPGRRSGGDDIVQRRSQRDEDIPRNPRSSGLLVLLVPVALSTCKPRGMNRHGWRKQQDQCGLLRS